MPRPIGLYDEVLTDALKDALARTPAVASARTPLSKEELAARLSEVLAAELRDALVRLADRRSDDGESDAAVEQVRFVNELLVQLRARLGAHGDPLQVARPPELLRAIHPPGVQLPPHPGTGLAQPWLFTAGKGSPSLYDEIRRETAACDHVDVLVSFITRSGVRKMQDVLERVTAVDAEGRTRTTLRVLTTTYTGATEADALDELARLPGVQVRVSLDGRRTRLHAKAWIFGRRSGYGTAYVGSANLSAAALLGGLEWTVKFTQSAQPSLYHTAVAQFDSLWESGEFTPYRPDDEGARLALRAALAQEKGGSGTFNLAHFDIRPHAYQQEMLDRLAGERTHGRTRNLLVAATGTGKTVVAALDYRRLAEVAGSPPRLLFVAHRALILRQARRTYREVLRNAQFGELLTGEHAPGQCEHLFATINSVTSQRIVERLGAGYWNVVVIDECHRIAAQQFDRFATAVRPSVLLGLTATPERGDGRPLAPYFHMRPDGGPAAELRLWQALDAELLSPFEYFGVHDDTDFTTVPWGEKGKEEQVLSTIVAQNRERARLVVTEWARLGGNPLRARALAFCVDVAHAAFMGEQFKAAGIPCAVVLGTTAERDRVKAIRELQAREISVIVTVDLFNEGIDIPEVDTLLLLRPTQSPVVFQQQIGRGLRLAPGKTSCLVLDFVGQHRAEYRMDRLLGSLLGMTRRDLERSVRDGFDELPPGCHVQLAPQAREQVLRALRNVANRWAGLVAEVQAYSALRHRDVRLAAFVREQAVDIRDIYRDQGRDGGWSALLDDAGLLTSSLTDRERYFSRRFGDLLHINDPARIAGLQRVAEARSVYSTVDSRADMALQMLAYQIDSSRSPVHHSSLFGEVRASGHCRSEMSQLAEWLASGVLVDPVPVPGLEDTPLALHGAYRIREIRTAVGSLTATKYTPFRAGVLPLDPRKQELLFVTMDKSEARHARVAYRDLALSTTRFRWETQNSVTPESTAGRRYLESRSNGWRFQLFVRTDRDAPYFACGPVTLESTDDVTGSRPMAIEWTLQVPLPIHLYRLFSHLRG